MFGASLRCRVCNQYTPDRCVCPVTVGPNLTAAQAPDLSKTQSVKLEGPILSACNCIGPQNGQPRCPCMMRGVVERGGRWIQVEVDLGPAS